MYSIVKGISYSTINSSLNTSSLCDHWPWRTTASNERVKGLGTGWDTNTQTYLKLFDYQSAPSALEDKHTKKKTCEIMQPFKIKKKNKNKHWATSWHLLDETEWKGEKGGGRSRASSVPGLGRGEEEAPHPSPSLPSPTCCRGRVWAWLTVMSIGHIWIFFLTVFWPPPPPPTPLHMPSISLPWCSCFNWPSI